MRGALVGPRWHRLGIASLVVALIAVVVPRLGATGQGGTSSATAVLKDANGKVVGAVSFQQQAGRVAVGYSLANLPAGFHGFHVHAVGTCTAPDFTSAGGHFNPGNATHPAHAGDQPVVLVNADGFSSGSFATDRFSVGDLFDSDGSAVIVHANADNYANIPTRYATNGPDQATLNTGDAGGRIACGIVQATSDLARTFLTGPNGGDFGTITIRQIGDRLRVYVLARGLPTGFHGFHVHAVGTCTPPDFTSAGGHFNPTSGNHPEHAGDQPVLLVNGDGTARATFGTDRYTLAQLLDADGSAFIVHASPDNYANIPARYAPNGPDQQTLNTGDAGGRIACGVIRAA